MTAVDTETRTHIRSRSDAILARGYFKHEARHDDTGVRFVADSTGWSSS
ncbi:MAG: hypothetical protein M3466_11265 [Gemmatimonadota bacterium]|nr:hypothetical protein [Gemmatimonadota bacterium]